MGRKKLIKHTTRFGRTMNLTLTFLLIAAITYGFLSLCYWDYNITGWGGFGRFVLATEGVIYLIKLIDEW